MNSNSQPWRVERKALDVRALMVELEGQRRVIKTQSWNEGSWDAVFKEACAMGPLLRELEREWAIWYDRVRALLDADD